MMIDQANAPRLADNPLARFAEQVGGTILAPRRTLNDVATREAWLPALALVVLVSALTAVADLAAIVSGYRTAGGGLFALEGSGGSLVQFAAINSVLWSVFWGPVIWAVVTLALFGVAYLLGGRGKFFGLWSATGFAYVPQLMMAPVWIAIDVLSSVNTALYIFAYLVALPLGLLAFLWTLVLLGVAVQESMGLSAGRATAAVVLPLAVAVGAMLLFLWFIMALIVALIAAAA